eukprot:gene4622-5773_t
MAIEDSPSGKTPQHSSMDMDTPSSGKKKFVSEEGFVYGGDEKHFPPSIKYIMGNEICERYSFYGLKSILNPFFQNFMGYSSGTAGSIMHGFNFMAYFFPLFGAYIADSRLGKYKTLLYFSIIYCVGGIFLTLSAVPKVVGDEGSRSPWAWIIGIIFIALGTGGIKPVVSAFCGDQLGPHQKNLLEKIFQIFYWCVNLGSLFSTIITPVVKTEVGFWLAFMIPSCLLVFSTMLLVIGNKQYVKRPPTGSVVLNVFRVICSGVGERFKSLSGSYDDSRYQGHWLDRVKGKYEDKFIEDTKIVLRVLLVFVPLPFFWAVYDQTSTTWYDQSVEMNLRLGSVVLEPEQVGAVNPLLVLMLVPFFDFCVYRPLAKAKINFSPLRKMGTGMGLAVIAFLISMGIQLHIDNSPPKSVHVFLQIPQYFVMTCGEVLLSITGLEFAYSQSPPTMKSIIMAAWLFCVSIGNMLDMALKLIEWPDVWLEILIFSIIVFVFTLVFIFIAIRYKMVDQTVHDFDANNTFGRDSTTTAQTELDTFPSKSLDLNSSSASTSSENNNNNNNDDDIQRLRNIPLEQ